MQTTVMRARSQTLGNSGVRSRGRKMSVCVHARRSTTDPSPEILTAFFYGRALAITVNQRISEAVIDLVSDVSKSIAERPQRIAEFQEEVIALARKDMSSNGFLPETTTATGSSAFGAARTSGSGATAGGVAAGGAPPDPQAAIDELRAEIAYARASLNELRAAQRAAAAQN